MKKRKVQRKKMKRTRGPGIELYRDWREYALRVEGEFALALDTIHELREELKRKNEPIWQSGAGPVRVSSLQDDHLRNAISYCTRRLLHELGTAVWLKHNTQRWARGLADMLAEADKRRIAL